jgi:hypothetical protein
MAGTQLLAFFALVVGCLSQVSLAEFVGPPIESPTVALIELA